MTTVDETVSGTITDTNDDGIDEITVTAAPAQRPLRDQLERDRRADGRHADR